MRCTNPSHRSPSRRARKQSQAAEACLTEELQLEIKRLKALLRDPSATEQQRARVQLQIAEYQEIAGRVPAAPGDWLRQMHLLAE